MRIKRALSALLCVALLTGCGTPLANGKIEEMLRAPQTGGRQTAVQKALNSYLGETLQLKYPRGGQEMSPMLFADLDDDNTQEAIVLYLAQSKGQNVHMAVLEENEAGWEVTFEIEGLSTEVASVEFAEVTGRGTQLLVGYANATLSDAYLSVYDYNNETVTRLFEQSYTQYFVGDLDGQAPLELLVVPQNTQPGALTLQLVRMGEEGLQVAQSLLLDERFVSCNSIQIASTLQRRGVVIDGTLSAGGLANEMFRLTENGTLTQWPALEGVDIVRSSLRYLADLPATRLSNSDAVFIPTDVTVSPTLSSSRRFYYMAWHNVLYGEPERFLEEGLPDDARFGLYDSTHGYFVRLPNSWRDTVSLVDGSMPGDWQLRAKDGNALLMSVRVADSGKPLGLYTPVASLGEQSLQIYFTDQCPLDAARLIRTGIFVF